MGRFGLMPNVDTITVIEDSDMNPLDSFKFSDEELIAYLKENKIDGKKKKSKLLKYKDIKKMDKPIWDTLKMMVFAWKDGGKTHFINTMSELDAKHGNKKKRSGVKYDPELNHLKFGLEKGWIKPGGPLEILDAEGKGDILAPKFENHPNTHRDLHHPDGPMPTMGDPVAFVKEFVLWLKSIRWAANHPDQYKEITGDRAPSAAAFENYTILTNEIMNYVRTVSFTASDQKVDKIKATGKELGGGLVGDFENWDVRNRNWDYVGGDTIRVPFNFTGTARARRVWKNNKPTDDEDAALYAAATHAFHCIIYLYTEKDAEGCLHFYAQIISSDFMDKGIRLDPIEDPSYPKIVAQLVKYDKIWCRLLDKYGTWKKIKKDGNIIEVWIENKKEEKK
jgi:hypothetical protein